MNNVLQVLAAIQAMYQHFGPAIEPYVIGLLEQAKLKYAQPWELAAINALELAIKSSLPTPTPTPGA